MLSDSANVDMRLDLPQANMLPIHPTGILFSRINQNFRSWPTQKVNFQINISSANVWLMPARAFRPLEVEAQNRLKSLKWFERKGAFNANEVNSESIALSADAVIKSFQFRLGFPVGVNQDMNMNIRSYLITGGKLPFTVFTGDKFIEWFHDKIIDDKDMYARNSYDYNQGNIQYRDEDNRLLKYDEGDFIVPGIDLDYTYYWRIYKGKTMSLQTNLSPRLGFNFSKYFQSIDAGGAISFMSRFKFNKKSIFNFGVGLNALYPGIEKSSKNVNINDNRLIPSFETMAGISFLTRKQRSISLGVNYKYQWPYNNPDQLDYTVLEGSWSKTEHWHYSITHLYFPLKFTNFFLSFKGRYQITLYLMEDFTINNAPDFQTGVELQIPLNQP